MFSQTLFSARTKDAPLYVEGKAESLSILCKIFTSPQNRTVKWKHDYIERFYAALSHGLKSDIQSLTSALLHFPVLLAIPLPGIRAFVPDLVVACRRVLTTGPSTPTSPRPPPEELRRAALRVLGSIIGSINLHGSIEIEPLVWESRGGKEVLVTEQVREVYAHLSESSSLSGIKPFLLDALIQSLLAETTSTTCRYILYLLHLFAVEDGPYTDGVSSLIIRSIYERLSLNTWSNEVAYAALQVLSQLAEVGTTNSVNHLVITLCRYAETQMSNVFPSLPSPLLVGRTFDTIIKWVLLNEDTQQDQELVSIVVQTLTQGLAVLDKSPERDPDKESEKDSRNKGSRAHKTRGASRGRSNDSPLRPLSIISGSGISAGSLTSPLTTSGYRTSGTAKEQDQILPVLTGIKFAAEMALSHLLTHLRTFPPTCGGSQTSHEWSEKAYFEKLTLDRKSAYSSCRYFVWKGRGILGVIEDMEKEGRVQLVMRQPMGKYCWTSDLMYTDSSEPKLPDEELNATTNRSRNEEALRSMQTSADFILPQELLLASLPHDATIPEESADKDIVHKLTKWMWDRQFLHHDRVSSGGHHDGILPAVAPRISATDRYSVHPKFQFGRMYLSHFGLLELDNRAIFMPLPVSDRLFNELAILDTLPTRECFSVSVLYCQSGEVTPEEITQLRPSTNSEFVAFTRSLGWMISLSSHCGFKGHLSPKSSGDAIYFADREVEIIFQIPSLYAVADTESIPTEPSEERKRSVTVPSELFSFSAEQPRARRSQSTRRQSEAKDSHWPHLHTDEEDLVTIVWIEDLQNFEAIPKLLGGSSKLFLFVHPLKNSKGLFCIRILLASGALEDHLTISPLVESMIVSSHTLGTLVRQTTIAAHIHCRYTKENWQKRSYWARKTHIEDLGERLRVSPEISGFYPEFFM